MTAIIGRRSLTGDRERPELGSSTLRSMPTRDEVIAALRPVNDPEIHRSIVELGMVKGVEIAGGTVTVEIALTVPGCPLKDFFNTEIPRVLKQLKDVQDVRVRLGTMSEDELRALRAELGHPDAIVTPFNDPASRTRVIAIGSGKGGVGKTTVTVNFAASLQRLGYSVGLLDADVWGFSVPRMLGISGRPDQAEGKIVPLEGHGLRAISMGMFVPEEQPVIWRGPMLHKALSQFLADVEWGSPDFLVVDMPPGTGDITISLAQILPNAQMVVVTTPQDAAQKVAERAARVAETTKAHTLGVIENMAGYHCPTCGHEAPLFGEGGGQALADSLGVPLLGRIPLDVRLREQSDAGEPYVLRYPDTAVARSFEDIAQKTAGWLGVFAEKQVFVSIGSKPARAG
jgi:ATP-binding protein involved in chromosome partitioning